MKPFGLLYSLYVVCRLDNAQQYHFLHLYHFDLIFTDQRPERLIDLFRRNFSAKNKGLPQMMI